MAYEASIVRRASDQLERRRRERRESREQKRREAYEKERAEYLQFAQSVRMLLEEMEDE